MDDRPVDLAAAELDVAIRSGSGSLPASALIACKLVHLCQAFCASPNYIDRHGLPVTPAALAEHNCVLFSLSCDANKWTLVGDDEPETVLV
ncbi:MAG: DNA-binding transcriptional LysR family regulator [Granulosicoccus sp.]|jgi:DNA-binding transcriptional LysR family regulator